MSAAAELVGGWCCTCCWCWLACLLPLVWMASTSIKPAGEALSRSVGVLPELADGEHPNGRAATDGAYWGALGKQEWQLDKHVLTPLAADFRLYIHNNSMVVKECWGRGPLECGHVFADQVVGARRDLVVVSPRR